MIWSLIWGGFLNWLWHLCFGRSSCPDLLLGKGVLQLYWNHTSVWVCSSVNLLHISRTPSPKNTLDSCVCLACLSTKRGYIIWISKFSLLSKRITDSFSLLELVISLLFSMILCNRSLLPVTIQWYFLGFNVIWF